MRLRRGHMMMQLWLEQSGNPRISITPAEFFVFVGLDMTPVEEAIKSDTRHAIIMGIILLLIGFSGIVLLFLAQSYRAARTSLSRIKAFSDNVVEHMPIGLVALDSHQHITSLNHVAGAVLSLQPDDAAGKVAKDVLPPELCNLLGSLDDNKGIIEKEIDCTLREDKKVPLEVSATLLNDESGTFLGYVLLFKDLSEVRSLRKEIARSQRLASVGRLEHTRLKEENRILKESLGQHFDSRNIIGRSPAMADLLETVAHVAPSEATVMITGESGTGKELVAGALRIP